MIATWWWLLPGKFTLRCLFLHISSTSAGLLSKSEEFKSSHQLHPSSTVDHHKTPLLTSLYHSKIHRGNPKICELSGLPWKNLMPSWTVRCYWAQAIDVLMILVIAKLIFQIRLRFFCWWLSNPIIIERMYILLRTHTSPPKEFPFPEVRYYVGSPEGKPWANWKNYYQLLVIPRPAPHPPSKKTGCGWGTTIL